jgi:hypothetical protein
MAARRGPLLRSLIYDKAFAADDLTRPEIADSHQGQGRDRSYPACCWVACAFLVYMPPPVPRCSGWA